jgi:hypothetical protein
MRRQSLIFISVLCALLFAGCTGEEPARPQAQKAEGTAVPEGAGASAAARKSAPGRVEISFPFVRQGGIATNQFAVWIEDSEGNFVKTLYVTAFTAQGGYKSRKESIPAWVERSKIAELPESGIDAVSGATPRAGDLKYTWDCADQGGNPVPGGNYKFFVEGTLFWESGVLYSGTIAVGGAERSEAGAAAEYSSEDEKNKNMLGAVTAVYIPEDGG